MASHDAIQERQLVLMEGMNKRLDAISESQKKLDEKNHNLQEENHKLRRLLERQQAQECNRRATRSSRRQCNVEIPNDLRKRFRFIYNKLVEKRLTQGFNVNEGPHEESNQEVFTKIKEILKKEHGGENCPWTDLQMEGQFFRYYKTLKERSRRIEKGKNEEHKALCKKNRRLLTKLERRCSGYDLLKSSLSARDRKSCEEILFVDYMSSEESSYEDEEDPITGEASQRLVGYSTRKLAWERQALSNIKARLDRAHTKNLTPHARQMAKPRSVGIDSERPAPEGPSWAVRLPQATVSQPGETTTST